VPHHVGAIKRHVAGIAAVVRQAQLLRGKRACLQGQPQARRKLRIGPRVVQQLVDGATMRDQLALPVHGLGVVANTAACGQPEAHHRDGDEPRESREKRLQSKSAHAAIVHEPANSPSYSVMMIVMAARSVPATTGTAMIPRTVPATAATTAVGGLPVVNVPVVIAITVVPVAAIARTTIPAAADADAHAGRIAAAVVAIAIIAVVVTRGVAVVVARCGVVSTAAAVVGIAGISRAAHVAVAGIVVTARQGHGCCGRQRETSKLSLHDSPPRRMMTLRWTTTLELTLSSRRRTTMRPACGEQPAACGPRRISPCVCSARYAALPARGRRHHHRTPTPADGGSRYLAPDATDWHRASLARADPVRAWHRAGPGCG